ncbi:MAG: hypothetical protein KDK12_12755 [Rhodobacteraceae bacterium]|nr:hypothetical protein [Paracoccaceae bacterium]
MKTKFIAATLAAFTAAGSFAGIATATPPLFPVNPQLQPLQPVIPPLIICPDLRVSVSVAPLNASTVRATVRLTNVSPTNYSGAAGQQRVSLRLSGGFAGTETLQYNFHSVAHGSTLTFTYDRPVNSAPWRAEADLRLHPSVYSDANPFNNECNSSNNSSEWHAA